LVHACEVIAGKGVTMFRVVLPLAVSLLFAAGPVRAQAQSAILLEPGDAISFRVETDGTMSASPREAADWAPIDVAAARHLSGLPIPDRAVPYGTPLPDNGTIPAASPPRPGMIRVKFLSIAGRHSLLVVENGYDRAIVYRARMTRDGQTRPTDVCLIMPGQHGF
jgi:hypothetical protein